MRATFKGSKLAELIANKPTVLDKIRIVKELDVEILDLVKDDEIEDEMERQLLLNYFLMEN